MIVRGDVAGCRSLGATLTRAAGGAGTAVDDLSTARGATSAWDGDAGSAWQDLSQRQSAAGRELARALAAAGRALTRFADDLDDAQRTAGRATAVATGAGLPVSAEGDVPPVHVPMGPYATPEQAADAARAARQAEARADALALVAQARAQEEHAHTALRTALAGLSAAAVQAPWTGPQVGPSAPGSAPVPLDRGLQPPSAPGWNDWLDLANGLVLSPTDASARAQRLASARGADAKALKALMTQAPPAQAAALRREWRAGLRSMREARASAARLATAADRLGPLTTAARAGSYAPAVPVLRHVPVFNVVMTGVGVQLDRGKGLSTGHAVVKNVASTASGMAVGGLVTGGLGTALAGTALGAGVVAAAPVLIGVGVGAFVGYGVGWAVEELGDDVADLAGQAWDALF